MQSNVFNHRHFKLWILLEQIIYVWNTKGLNHQIPKTKGLEHLSVWQRLNSFAPTFLFKLVHAILKITNKTFFSGQNFWTSTSHNPSLGSCVSCLQTFGLDLLTRFDVRIKQTDSQAKYIYRSKIPKMYDSQYFNTDCRLQIADCRRSNSTFRSIYAWIVILRHKASERRKLFYM